MNPNARICSLSGTDAGQRVPSLVPDGSSEGRMQYAPTARYLTGFAFVLPQVSAKPAGFHSDLWQSPNPAGFRAMSCGKVQNPPGFWCTRVGACCIRPQMFLAKGLGLKPGKFYTYPCRAQKHTPRNVLRQEFAAKTGRGLGVSLLGKCETGQVFHVPV